MTSKPRAINQTMLIDRSVLFFMMQVTHSDCLYLRYLLFFRRYLFERGTLKRIL